MSIARVLFFVLLVGSLPACVTHSVPVAPADALGATPRQRIAALLRRQPDFGSISLIPVRFENSRIVGPLEEKGRTHYCVRTEMHGRTFGKPERPKAIVRQEAGPGGISFAASAYDEDICSGHRSEPFPELDDPSGKAP